MKNFIFIIFLTLTTIQTHSYADTQKYNCREIYQKFADHDNTNKKNFRDLSQPLLHLGNAVSYLQLYPVSLVIYLSSLSSLIYSGIPTDAQEANDSLGKYDERILEHLLKMKDYLSKEDYVKYVNENASWLYGNSFIIYLNEMQRRYPNLNSYRLHEVIESGLESGYFCKNLPKLASQNDLNSYLQYILDQTETKIVPECVLSLGDSNNLFNVKAGRYFYKNIYGFSEAQRLMIKLNNEKVCVHL